MWKNGPAETASPAAVRNCRRFIAMNPSPRSTLLIHSNTRLRLPWIENPDARAIEMLGVPRYGDQVVAVGRGREYHIGNRQRASPDFRSLEDAEHRHPERLVGFENAAAKKRSHLLL